MAAAPLRPVLGPAAPASQRLAKQGAGAGHAFAAALAELAGLGGLGHLATPGGPDVLLSTHAAAPHKVLPSAGEPPLGEMSKSAVREHAAKGAAKRPAEETEREAAGDLLHLVKAAQAAPAPLLVAALAPAPAPAKLQLATAAGQGPAKAFFPAQAPTASPFTATPLAIPARSAPKPAAAGARAAWRAAFESKQGINDDAVHEKAKAADPRKQTTRAHAAGHEQSLVQPAPPHPQSVVQSAPSAAQQAAAAPEHAGSEQALPPSLAASVEADESLRLVVLPNSANLKVTTPDGGDLSVHLRVRDGVTNVTVSGTGSEAAMAHSSDLRAALAGQGLTLGRIDRASAGAAGAAEVAGPRARVRSGERGEGRSARTSSTEESVNEVAAEGLARSLQ